MSALDDEETQRKGFIFVDYSMGAFTQARHFNPQLCIPVTRLTLSRIPCKLRGIHLCYEDPKIHKIASFFISKLGAASSITRLRLHHGSHTECKYQVRTNKDCKLLLDYTHLLQQLTAFSLFTHS